MQSELCVDLIPLQNDPTDLRIMQLIESLRQDDERESAVASLVSEYRAKVDELNKAKERGGGGGGGGGGGTKGKERAAAGPSVAAHQRHVRTLHRLSLQCPHNGTRTELKKLMELVASCDAFTVSPIPRAVASAYLDNDNIPSLVDGGAAAGEEFVEAFRADGRVSHMTQVMACHPEYLTRFREVHNWLLWDEGPLPLPDRHLIAVMAAGRHNCRYLAEIHTKHFLDLGGDPDWLMGAAHLPPKLRSLVHLNAVLAHQPWRLVVDDIAQLVKSGVDSWSLNELVQALSIMIHFHALQSFVLGCGIAMEVDLNPVCDGLSDDGAAAAVDGGEPAVPLSVFVEVRDKLRADGDVTGPDDTEEANLKAFADAETEEAKSPQQQQAVLPSAQWFPLFECSLLSNSPDRSIPGHEDFNIRSKEYTVFRTTSFSWEDQCYSTLSRYCPEIAELFDAEFSTITALTYKRIGDEEGINTTHFREAIWNYTLRTKGVVNDEYMYRNVNQYLPREVKSYVKTAVCYPQLSTKSQWVKIDTFKDSERVHINLLAMCARKQSSLLYALNAVSQFVNSRE